MRILVTGSSGQLGSELKDLVPSYTGFDFVFASREQLPLDEVKYIRPYLDLQKPNIIINAAAYTAVDLAEKEVDLADRINHLAPKEIAAWCYHNRAKLIHISTDYVFDGETDIPLKEDGLKRPINVYGWTKHLGEEAIFNSRADAIIVRTAWVYSAFGKNFVKTMLRLMSERDKIAVVNDQIGSPTYAKDLAEAILTIIASGDWFSGIYHYSNEGELSWYDFAVAIRDCKNLDCQIDGIPSTAYPTPAKRPKFSLLDKEKIKETFGVHIPHWRSSLEMCLAKL